MSRYTGQGFFPLPYESAFSQIARVAMLNEMDASTFLSLVGLRDQDREWSVLNRIFMPIDEFQWCRCDTETPRQNWKLFDRRFCSTSLRVCDECVGSMYHSLWHQCWAVSECPVHGCPLRTVCPFCNREYGDYTFSQAVSVRFCCRHCQGSLSTTPVTIARHLALRAITARLEALLANTLKQLLTVAVVGRRLSHLEASFPFRQIDRWWPNKRSCWDVLLDVSCVYNWQARISPALTWLVWPSSHRLGLRDFLEVDTAYCQTLASLKCWLVELYPELVDAGECPDLFDGRGVPRTDLWPPEFLAFMLLRRHVEENAQSWGLNPGAARIPHTSKFHIICKTTRHRMRSQGFAQAEFIQATIYGRFAALYWAIKNGALNGKRFQIEDYVTPCLLSHRSWEPDIAAVVFPAIKGMPLGKFDPSPLRFKDAFELLYRDGLSRQRELHAVRRADVTRGLLAHGDQGT